MISRLFSRHAMALLGAFVLTGCHITIDADGEEWVWDSDRWTSSSETSKPAFVTELDQAGRSSSFTLSFGEGTGPTLRRVNKVTEPVAYLGVETESLDRDLALSLGVEPWSGVRVTRVLAGSPAAGVGLVPGDLLRDLNGQPITSAAQFTDLVAGRFEPDERASLAYSRVNATDGRVEMHFDVTFGARSDTRRSSELVELASLPAIESSTGIQLAEVPADWSADLFGEDPVRVLVSGVWIGSPAYFAGIRSGDRIESWNGAPVTSLEEIEAAASGAAAEHVVEVSGNPGAHTAAVGTADLDHRSLFHVPILAKYKKTIRKKRVSFLNFIFQFGFNYRRNYLATDSREPAKHTELSILPLGMFEFERSPNRTRNRLFWFITWGTDDD